LEPSNTQPYTALPLENSSKRTSPPPLFVVSAPRFPAAVLLLHACHRLASSSPNSLIVFSATPFSRHSLVLSEDLLFDCDLPRMPSGLQDAAYLPFLFSGLFVRCLVGSRSVVFFFAFVAFFLVRFPPISLRFCFYLCQDEWWPGNLTDYQTLFRR